MGSETRQAAGLAPAAPQDDFPPPGDLRKMVAEHPLPTIDPETVGPIDAEEAGRLADITLGSFNAAAAAGDVEALEACFFPQQAFWRDQLALTCHLRTFFGPAVISAAFLETKGLRSVPRGIQRNGPAQLVSVSPVLQFIDLGITFTTESPAATCRGNMLLLPLRSELEGGREVITRWKIWTLSTWMLDLAVQPEDDSLFKSPARRLHGLESFETEVLIIGGGNGGVALSARLKALGVDNVILERNKRIGDNWGRRYDCLSLHTPAGYSQMPFMRYGPEFSGLHFVPRDELAEHLRRYVATFNLNFITSATPASTVYNESTKKWTVEFKTPEGTCKASCQHLVQATGILAPKPYVPQIENEQVYQGLSIHSTQFRNGTKLAEQGVQSVILIGAASTGLDLMEDCHAAGLRTTIVARSATFIVPAEHLCHEMSLGLYEIDAERADVLFMTTPTCVDSALAKSLFAHLMNQKPDRYTALKASGFEFTDSTHPDGQIMHHLLERGGAHYVDKGGTKLIAEGRVAVKSRTEPVAFTETGLRFSDGSTADADAIVWCTGFADMDVRRTAAEVLGDRETGASRHETEAKAHDSALLGPRAIAERLESTWGIDAEGEIRGLWKRQQCIDNYWVMGGNTQHHRWHSKTLALQIKAALEGILPPAYRSTPEPEPGF